MEQNVAKFVEEAAGQNQVPASMSIEDIIEQSIGRINATQILQAILTALAALFDSQQTYISIFAHAQPTWHCTSSNTNSKISCSSNNNSNICRLSKSDWAWDSPNVHTSIISEWDLECASSFITGFPTTCYFVGCLLGGLVLATLGDSSIGRKKLLCISFLFMSLAALASSFSPNLWVYSLLRFLCGIGRAPLTITSIVLQTEKTCKRWRSQLIMIGFINISLGILTLTGIAYLTKASSWRNLYLWTSIPGIICSLICYYFILESPRWLFMQGRTQDSMAVLKKLGSSTSLVYSTLIINNMANLQEGTKESSSFASLKILINKRWAVKRLLATMLLAFGLGLMYFGMFLGVGNLGFNIYLTAAFSALLSLLSYLITFIYWVPRCNRRISLLGFCVISGTTSIIFSVLGNHSNQGLIISLEVVSLFCACMAYNLVLMYTVELFPTCVRNSASLIVRQSMIFGSVFDPVLILLGRQNKMYSYGVFGITVLVCGFLVLSLPETRGKVLCDTMEEQELRDV